MTHIAGTENLADILTKPVNTVTFNRLVKPVLFRKVCDGQSDEGECEKKSGHTMSQPCDITPGHGTDRGSKGRDNGRGTQSVYVKMSMTEGMNAQGGSQNRNTIGSTSVQRRV